MSHMWSVIFTIQPRYLFKFHNKTVSKPLVELGLVPHEMREHYINDSADIYNSLKANKLKLFPKRALLTFKLELFRAGSCAFDFQTESVLGKLALGK